MWGWECQFSQSRLYLLQDVVSSVWATVKMAVHRVVMWILHRRKSSRHSPQQVKWRALSFGIGKGWSFWISWNLVKTSALTAISKHWLSWRLEIPESEHRGRQPFSCKMITPGFITALHTKWLQRTVSESAWRSGCTTINNHNFEFNMKTLRKTNVSSR